MTSEELHHLARQLSCPEGEFGIHLAENMNETNIGMTRNAMSHLKVSPNDYIMELGYANGAHLAELFAAEPSIRYAGYEVSETMHAEARKINAAVSQNIGLWLYDGRNIPAPDNHFDKGFCVNTLYFWPDVRVMLNETARVLKPNGHFCLTFAERDSMEQLPFTDHVFHLYMPEDIEALLPMTGFQQIGIDRQFEDVVNKTGHHIKRHYVTLILQKSVK